jgi:hypothetical protein
MSIPPYAFGSVLFDELQQLAVRRGGFASLNSLLDEVINIRRNVEMLAWAATDLRERPQALTGKSDKIAQDATKVLERVTASARAISELGRVVRTRCETAASVVDKFREPVPHQPPPVAFRSLLTLYRAIMSLTQTPSDPVRWELERQEVIDRMQHLLEELKAAQRALDVGEDNGLVAQAQAAGEKFERLCRLARGLTAFDSLNGADHDDAVDACSLVFGAFNNCSAKEQLVRSAVVQRARSLYSALTSAVEQVDIILKAYRPIANASRGIASELSNLIKDQSDASRYELYDILEDGARKAAMRLETVGLAFSGGGIRSATFNLGFLQGMASLRLLKRFDYLSTVSGGGYIGAWFAAWVRREGGAAGDPLPPSEESIEEAAKLEVASERAKMMSEPPTPSDEIVEAWIKTASDGIRLRVLANLLKEYEAKVAANDALPAAEKGAGPARPDKAAVNKIADPLVAKEAKRIRRHAQNRYIHEQLKECEKHARQVFEAKCQAQYEAECQSKLRRTARALENVETQLNTRRVVQLKADRRWVSSREISDGREAIVPSPRMLKRVVEEEPEPIHHLRAYSNYLAPKVGLLSIDTWTMVSVYLRNLLVNQFILLPMTLAAIAVPRLLIILFASSRTKPILTLATGWLDDHAGWPVLLPLGGGLLAILTVPKLVDYFAHATVERVERRYAVRSGLAIVALLALGLAAVANDIAAHAVPALAIMWFSVNDRTKLPRFVLWLSNNSWIAAAVVLFPMILAVAFRRFLVESLASRITLQFSPRTKGWIIIFILLLGTTAWVGRMTPPLIDLLALVPPWLPPLLLASLLVIVSWFRSGAIRMIATMLMALGFILSTARWLNIERIIFASTVLMAGLGFWRTYQVVALIRHSRRPASLAGGTGTSRFDLPFPVLCEQILIPFTLVAFGVSLLFARADKPFFSCPFPNIDIVFDPKTWGKSTFLSALVFGALVGSMRLLASALIEFRKPFHKWKMLEQAGRATAAFASGLVAGATLAGVLMALNGWLRGNPGVLAATMMSFGPLLVFAAISAGSAIEVGLIGHYGDEDMREWRASVGAYLLIIGTLWASFSALSIYGPLLIWKAGDIVAAAAGATWLVTSISGALAGRSARTDGVKTNRSPLEYIAIAAPTVFIIGLVVSVAMLATALQGVHLPLHLPENTDAGREFLGHLATRRVAPQTWAILLGSGWIAVIGCVYININLFSLNAFYANRLVRCYLGASRPREAPAEGRPNFAPTNSPVPVRRPNPITGFDPADDFPLRDLAIVPTWGENDLIVDYRGPYHLINAAMNLVAGSELAWQERMAESFIFSPLYCGSKTTSYRPTAIARAEIDQTEMEPEEASISGDRLLPGYGGGVRLGTAVSVSGAAASPNAGYHSSPLVAILMTVLNARLGLWFGNPARDSWLRSGPGFAVYLFDELFGRTTSKGKYVYLSDGGHFENLGVYELIRRRCRHIVLCDAGADPKMAFWDLGSLVRKCREDFGVRIEIDISPLLKRDGSAHARWHCAVGRIHYDDVDAQATPGTLFYVKPSLSGDEPSDVRNYVVDHPTFPHESTADQFFSESQFESYRALGEHIAVNVFRDVQHDAGGLARAASFFSRLRRRWCLPPPDLDKNFMEAVKGFVEVHKDFRGDTKLEQIGRELYPELERLLAAPSDVTTTNSNGEKSLRTGNESAEIHAVVQMLQVMENAWLGLNLDTYSDHPLNRGWMNVFRRWTSSGTLQRYWPTVRGEFSEGFVRFCESELNLTVDDPGVIWLNVTNQPGSGLDVFEKAISKLDKEFTMEWPDVISRDIGDEPLTLTKIFEHAQAFPPPGFASRSCTGLIVPGGRGHKLDSATAEPSHYGVILAWTASDGVIDLVVWLRGAYRTLGLGERIGKELDWLKEKLKFNSDGFVLRARYPSDDRSKGKQRWQSNLWADFFQDRGFHRQEPETAGDDMVTFVYTYQPI